jgi:hypothetical protein
LDKVVNKGSAPFTETDYEELIQFLLEDVSAQSPVQNGCVAKIILSRENTMTIFP